MAATVSLAKPAARAATARSRKAARTSSLSERVSGKGMVIAAPRRKGPDSIPQDTAAPKTIQGHLLLYFVAEVILPGLSGNRLLYAHRPPQLPRPRLQPRAAVRPGPPGGAELSPRRAERRLRRRLGPLPRRQHSAEYLEESGDTQRRRGSRRRRLLTPLSGTCLSATDPRWTGTQRRIRKPIGGS